jgi:hypothetical protein
LVKNCREQIIFEESSKFFQKKQREKYRLVKNGVLVKKSQSRTSVFEKRFKKRMETDPKISFKGTAKISFCKPVTKDFQK